MVTRRPRLFSSRPREEAVNPFPRLDATPPVTKMGLAPTTSASREPRPGARDPPRRCAGGHGGTPPNLPRRAATRRGWRADAPDGRVPRAIVRTMAEPVAAERTRPAVGRRTWRLDAAVLAAAAVVLRIPAFVASRHLTYDDGFFGLSALEMRHGVVPFRELFSPEGPLHLPLLFVADLVGVRTTNAPRLLPLLAGAVVTVGTYAAGRRIASRRGAILAAV